MPAYVIAHLQEAAPHPEIAEYMERITGTFEPYGGRFLVHATQHEVKEGSWPGHLVMIGFPGIAEARAWWDSPAYQEIAPLRSRHIDGDIIMIEGVPEGYDPTGTARALRESVPAEQSTAQPSPRQALSG
ncbi:DUF1330 domain-containing protein [Streptomyces sp. RY43-2]|uniref:DUF1330 domain-containing protein n=1 Tax=Streptomyces macrolidinus TaxID=2952607 RepID=A0ABT0ZIJ4_9ACTN|nr:DUF1330 domain-containing protein [Streptomyces macrolidinus]MCN9243376.1 DUF1330 domain-containing protein [Streptomyces macrolidinus]